MAERKMSMKNRMKRLSALVLAATMAMGTYTSAFAADMTVYLRSIGKNATAPTQEYSFTVHNVNFEFVERFPELSLFYRLFSPLDSEMICIFPYF